MPYYVCRINLQNCILHVPVTTTCCVPPILLMLSMTGLVDLVYHLSRDVARGGGGLSIPLVQEQSSSNAQIRVFFLCSGDGPREMLKFKMSPPPPLGPVLAMPLLRYLNIERSFVLYKTYKYLKEYLYVF